MYRAQFKSAIEELLMLGCMSRLPMSKIELIVHSTYAHSALPSIDRLDWEIRQVSDL